MKTKEIIGQFTYDRENNRVVEFWEDDGFYKQFPITAYMGVLRRVIFRANYFLATLNKALPYK